SGGFAEMAEPDIEILLPHLLQFQMRRHRATAIGAVLQDDRAPEVGHLFEMRLPVIANFRGEDRSKPRIGPYPAVEIADQRTDEGPVYRRMLERHFRWRGCWTWSGWRHDTINSGISCTT